MIVGVVGTTALDRPLEDDATGDGECDGAKWSSAAGRHELIPKKITFGERADELGFDLLYEAERHFDGWRTSPSPIQVGLAVAAETRDIGVLPSLNLLTHHPVRLAEKLGILDVVSDGQLEVGLSRRATELESDVLGRSVGGSVHSDTRSRASFREKAEVLIESWTEGFVDHHGAFHDVPPSYVPWEEEIENAFLRERAENYDITDYVSVEMDPQTLSAVPVSPQPRQNSHPQCWRAVTSATDVEWSARNGINCVVSAQNVETASNVIDLYHETAEASGWPDRRPGFDGEPFDRGWNPERGRGVLYALDVFVTDVASPAALRDYALSKLRDVDADPGDDPVGRFEQWAANRDDVVVGESDRVASELDGIRSDLGVGELGILVQVDGVGLSHEQAIEQLTAFATDVRPLVAA